MALTKAQLKTLRDGDASTGNRLALAIDLSGETQTSVGLAVDLPHTYVSDVARGRYQTITVENAHKFAEHFGCAIEDLFPAKEAIAS